MIYENSDITDNIQRATFVKPATAINPQFADSVVGVIDVTPKGDDIVKTATSTTTLHTTSSTKAFFLQGLIITGGSSLTPGINVITATINGAAVIIGACQVDTTITSNNQSISFSRPIRIDKNTNITSTLVSDTGRFIIHGYELEEARTTR